jgi:3-oxoacyl-[acyl-carrier protein] reductase
MTPEDSRITLVTGAGSGIGRAIAEKLARDGERVVVNDLNAATADEVIARIKESGGEATTAPGDVSDPQSVEQIMAAVREAYGSPEILVNNAGFL